MTNPFTTIKRWGSSAQNDWHAMFGIFAALFLLIVIAGFLFFAFTARIGDSSQTEEEELLSVPVIRRTALYYDERSAKFELLYSTPETTPDPSAK